MDAADGGRLEEVEALLRDDPTLDVNWGDDTGWTALHCACWNNHSELVNSFWHSQQLPSTLRVLGTPRFPTAALLETVSCSIAFEGSSCRHHLG